MTILNLPERTNQTDIARWHEPAGLNPRGTLVLLTGRGEPPEVYARFGRRLASDAYRVLVVSAGDHTEPGVRAEIAALLDDPEVVAPVVLVGSDAGARAALALASDPDVEVAGLVLAGLALEDHAAAADWPAEVEARTACPNHQQVLRRSARGSLASAASLIRLAPAPIQARVALPVLALHGGDDAISPLPAARRWYGRAGVAEVVVVAGGRHDILNDVSHRSVAATVVLFLERLRLGADLPLIVSPTASRP
ncbi:alpha/beta hydrolase [uncultured Friedmanniella sp.]|uniref:alpha/beta hydrolase n=1 Tax=uncultured Friedmanniella sp. TaxID=335381 RepID=UPI0035CAAEC4